MYDVRFTPEAEADLSRLSNPNAQRILKKLRWLAEHFENLKPEPLTGQLKGVFKLRVGDYRVLYTFNKAKQSIVIHLVKHRREVYKTR